MIERKYNWLLERENENGECTLRFRVKWDKNREIANFTLGNRVEKSKWSKETQRCKNNTTHTKERVSAYEINKKLAEFEQIADDIFTDFDMRKQIPTAFDFKQKFNIALGREIPEQKLLVNYIDQFVSAMGAQNSWGKRTYQVFRALQLQLSDFKPNFSIEDLNTDTMQKFLQFLIRQEYKNTYTEKILKNFNWFIRWLVANGLYNGNVHNTFKPRLKGTGQETHTVIYLSWDELQHLYNLEVNNIALRQVRDVFCFCCFTSLRYSDVKKLKRIDIKSNHIEVVTQKTSECLKIDLNDYSREILNRYKDYPTTNNSALPVISGQKMNEHLKDLCRLAGFTEKIRIVYFKGSERIEEIHEKWELITTHCGRRTFVVNALYLGIPAEVVMKWTGHSDYKAMKPYIAIVDDLKSKEMNKFNRDFKSAD